MRRLAVIGMVLLLAACSGMLPQGEKRVVSHWESYTAARDAFDRIEPYSTREEQLEALGFSPRQQPNVEILNHADIAERFFAVAMNPDNLPPGLRECLQRCESCYGYEVDRRVTHDRRYGNFWADFLNFKRKTETRGWSFNALVVLIDGQVVYKLWGGTPEIHEYRDETNPLGPLQGVGPSMVPGPSF